MTALDNGSVTSADILERMKVPSGDGKYDGVYVLGCLERRLTFHSQQQRAYNLIWALFAEGKLREGQRVAIVGGGLAGLTAAAAALLKGCKVALLEERETLLHLPWGNTTRYVHPNLYDWPRARSEHPVTDLPDLNWEAGPAGDVAKQVWDRWEEAFKDKNDLEVITNCTINFISRETGGIRITSARNWETRDYSDRFSCVILAVGFGVEKNLSPKCPAHSYWAGDELDPTVKGGPTPRQYLVTGCGDGGLVDILRLRIRDFSHENLMTALMMELIPASVKDRLIEIDRLANEKHALAVLETEEQREVARKEIGWFLEDEYKKLER